MKSSILNPANPKKKKKKTDRINKIPKFYASDDKPVKKKRDAKHDFTNRESKLLQFVQYLCNHKPVLKVRSL